MTIKEFVNKYENCAQQMKDKFINDNLKITTYVPFVKKDALINNLLKVTMINKETGNVNSAEYFLMTRILVENYTNLTVETEGFYEEYDELKKSGLFNVLLVGDDVNAPLIPVEEIAEFKFLLSQKKADYMTNHFTPQAFISNQIDRITTIGSITLKPVLEKIATELENIDDAKIDRIMKALDKRFKRVK